MPLDLASARKPGDRVETQMNPQMVDGRKVFQSRNKFKRTRTTLKMEDVVIFLWIPSKLMEQDMIFCQ